jgi:hypothetical protein
MVYVRGLVLRTGEKMRIEGGIYCEEIISRKLVVIMVLI